MTAALLATILSVGHQPPVEAALPLDAVVRRHGEGFVAGKPHLAVVVAVTTPAGRRTWGFGSFDRGGPHARPDSETLYEIGSITKTFTGTLLADLVRNGTVALDDPVRKHLPTDWRLPTRDGRDISLLHLATHTSSLPRMPPGFGPFLLFTGTTNDPYSKYTADSLRLTLSQVELDRPIGSRFEYSNLAMGLLGQAAAHAAATDVDGLFADRLLRPLHLDDTAFDVAEADLGRLAPPFEADGAAAHSWHFDCLKACGGLRSNANDLLTYAEAALGRTDTPLRPAFDLAMQPWRQVCEAERSVGLGWFTEPMHLPDESAARRGRLVWHGGGTGGYRTFLGLLPERGSALVILSNSAADVDPHLTRPLLLGLVREVDRR